MIILRLEREKELINILKAVAPGTPLREGLEYILRAKTGGLIVIGDISTIEQVVDGGFSINSDYSPTYLYELAKMDGAIVVSSDLKCIYHANTQLVADPSIPTLETGTRHRTADRVAKKLNVMVVAISQRRNVITVYKGSFKYVLRDSSTVLAKANQAIQTLERYITVLDRVVENLNVLEFLDLATLLDVITVVQRTEMVLRIVSEMERYIFELGNEGRLISMQLGELVRNVEEDGLLLIRDYCQNSMDYQEIYKQLQSVNYQELLELDVIARILGYGGVPAADTLISPRGYRMLNKIPRIPATVIENLIKSFKELKAINEASFDQLDKVEGIGEARAKAIKNGLRKLKEQFLLSK